MTLQSSAVKLAALELSLPVLTPEKARDSEFVAHIESLGADVLLVAAYGQILSKRLLESARLGAVNLHGSILPKYRGAAPIQRAIAAGDTETGVTLMQMDVGMDTGDQIAEVRTPIGPDETYGELHERLAHLASDLAVEWMPRIFSGDFVRVPQDNDQATMAPKIEQADCLLAFDQSAHEAYNRFRSVTRSPGARLETNQGQIKILEAARSESTATPGIVIETNPELVVAFEQGALILRKVQPAGKSPMSGRDWANGARLKPGMSLY